MDSIKLVYELRQDTPMIHFQYDETGACIRASELKPKLDAFIIKKYKNEIKSDWYIDKEKNDALNYKIRIIANGNPKVSETAICAQEKDAVRKPMQDASKDEKDKYKRIIKEIEGRHLSINAMYFGNMGDTDYKETIFYNQTLKLEIVCFISSLKELINEELLAEFLAINNFGTRQNKSFGGFSLKDTTGSDVLKLLKNKGYKFFYTCSANDIVDDQMSIASAIYAVMKGGINYTNIVHNDEAYIKGYIQRAYLDEQDKKNVGSDKAKIKKELMPVDDGGPQYDDYEFVRAMLGLADKYPMREGDVSIESIEKDKIERFKSPVTIKIIDKYIFFIFNDSYKKILGKKFKLAVNKRHTEISTPDEFNVDEFIEGFVQYFNDNASKINLLRGPYKKANHTILEKGN